MVASEVMAHCRTDSGEPVSLDNSGARWVVEQHRPTTRAPFSAAVLEKPTAVTTATAVSVSGQPMRRAAGLQQVLTLESQHEV